MDIINTIYNSPYFIPVLIVIIVILASLFVILLLTGRKGNKVSSKNEQDVNKNLETINNANLMNDVENNKKTKEEEIASFKFEPLDDKVENSFSTLKESPESSLKENEVKEPVAPQENIPDMFNTSIFHNMPSQLQDAANEVKVPENKEIPKKDEEVKNETISNIPDDLFEPLPNLDLKEDPILTKEELKPNNEVKNDFNEATISLPKINDLPNINKQEQSSLEKTIEPKPVYPKEKISMPNQFSSVYVNKEEPKVKEPKKEVNNNIPPYDPSLFQSYIKPKGEEKKETNTMDLDKTITNMSIPEIKAVPPLEPINNMDNNNFNNAFNFDLPALASQTETPKEDPKPSLEENKGPNFMNFNPETYDIKK